MATRSAKLSSKNQITVPAYVRERLDLHAYDQIEFVELPGGFLVKRAAEPRSILDLAGILPPPSEMPSADFEDEIRDAQLDRADHLLRTLSGE